MRPDVVAREQQLTAAGKHAATPAEAAETGKKLAGPAAKGEP